jgi:hypothetical protein
VEQNLDIFAELATVNWFGQCGVETAEEFPFPAVRLKSIGDVIASAQSDLWMDVRTEAQGDLTGYLAKNHYEAYGDWNRLANPLKERMEREVMPRVKDALGKMGAEVLSDSIQLDLTRIALWSTYSRRFRRVPDFFHRLMIVYEHSHLPCGWSGNLNSWPEGQLIIF